MCVLVEAETEHYSEFEPELVAGDIRRILALTKGDSSGGNGIKKLAGDGA